MYAIEITFWIKQAHHFIDVPISNYLNSGVPIFFHHIFAGAPEKGS